MKNISSFYMKLTTSLLLITMLAGPASFLGFANANSDEEINPDKSTLEIMNELSNKLEKWEEIENGLNEKFDFDKNSEADFLKLEKEKILKKINETVNPEQKETLKKLINIIDAEQSALSATDNLFSNLVN